jgi:hypothetical protein
MAMARACLYGTRYRHESDVSYFGACRCRSRPRPASGESSERCHRRRSSLSFGFGSFATSMLLIWFFA